MRRITYAEALEYADEWGLGTVRAPGLLASALERSFTRVFGADALLLRIGCRPGLTTAEAVLNVVPVLPTQRF